MNNKKKVLIVGGDLRQVYCSYRLAQSFDVYITGFDDGHLAVSDIKKADASMKREFDYVVLPVLAIKDRGYINAPFSEKEISVEYVKEFLKPSGIVFGGKLNESTKELFGGYKVYDYTQREEFNILNAIPSAEGAVQIALEELPVTLNGEKILITGYGRIGRSLAVILKGFGADVYVSARSAASQAWAKLAGVKMYKEISGDYRLIFNTVPEMLFTDKVFRRLNSDVTIIDLASKPGGVDFDAASQAGIKVIWALGLPGKTAPVTSGEIIADIICTIINERSAGYE